MVGLQSQGSFEVGDCPSPVGSCRPPMNRSTPARNASSAPDGGRCSARVCSALGSARVASKSQDLCTPQVIGPRRGSQGRRPIQGPQRLVETPRGARSAGSRARAAQGHRPAPGAARRHRSGSACFSSAVKPRTRPGTGPDQPASPRRRAPPGPPPGLREGSPVRRRRPAGCRERAPRCARPRTAAAAPARPGGPPARRAGDRRSASHRFACVGTPRRSVLARGRSRPGRGRGGPLRWSSRVWPGRPAPGRQAARLRPASSSSRCPRPGGGQTPIPIRISTATRLTAASAAVVGRRRAHLSPRRQIETGRARIGSPARNRARSSASSPASA